MQQEKVANLSEFISVKRADLLQSQAALHNLSKLTLPVQHDQYWMAKTIGKIMVALKRQLAAAQDESNRLIGELGEFQKDKDGNPTTQKGISQEDVETVKKYAAAMEEFTSQSITIEHAKPISLLSLEKAGVSLSLGDQAVLEWLFVGF